MKKKCERCKKILKIIDEEMNKIIRIRKSLTSNEIVHPTNETLVKYRVGELSGFRRIKQVIEQEKGK